MKTNAQSTKEEESITVSALVARNPGGMQKSDGRVATTKLKKMVVALVDDEACHGPISLGPVGQFCSQKTWGVEGRGEAQRRNLLTQSRIV